ncbi:MAG: hypothetical protein IJX76_00005 [Clostridia bacterium]|nr:hypothetical protein [Clostridia bacterium]
MTVHVLGLTHETLRLSDSRHSEIITKEKDAFTLSEGEREFVVEQIATAPAAPRGGWGMYLIGQIVSAIPRALPIRKQIYQRCNPILLSAKITVKPCRYDDFTLFFIPGAYSRDLHTFQPPKLEGDARLSIETGRYALDKVNVERAIKEETMSKLGYFVNLLAVPIFLFILFFLWLYRVLFHIALCLLPIMMVFCAILWSQSRKTKADLREKVDDTLRRLNGDP